MTHHHVCPSCQRACECDCAEPKQVHAICQRCYDRSSPSLRASLKHLWTIAGEPLHPLAESARKVGQ